MSSAPFQTKSLIAPESDPPSSVTGWAGAALVAGSGAFWVGAGGIILELSPFQVNISNWENGCPITNVIANKASITTSTVLKSILILDFANFGGNSAKI